MGEQCCGSIEQYGLFNKVKTLASKQEFSDAENKYKEAFIINLIKEYTFNTNDIYITKDNLLRQLDRFGGIDNIEEIITNAINHDYLIEIDNRIYLFDDYYDEKYIARYLKTFSNDLVLDEELINEGIINNENNFNIKYDSLQKDAIRNFFKNGISLIVGGLLSLVVSLI